jgi:hypothetical protein
MSPTAIPGNLLLKNGMVITGREAGPADPYIGNVSLLLHGDGANGSTTIIDSSPSPKTVTAFGDAQISTAQSKFGGSSIAFDGSGDYINTTSNASPDASSTFTVELWIYPTVVIGADRVLYECRDPGSPAGSGWVFFINTSARLQVYGNNGNLYGQSSSGVATGALSGFQHVALVCNAGTWTYYIQGQSAGAFNATPTAPQNTRIGAREDTLAGYNGYIDEFRITKGIARYTANFTPPTAPFPDI